jgi:hypothetical protein
MPSEEKRWKPVWKWQYWPTTRTPTSQLSGDWTWWNCCTPPDVVCMQQVYPLLGIVSMCSKADKNVAMPTREPPQLAVMLSVQGHTVRPLQKARVTERERWLNEE